MGETIRIVGNFSEVQGFVWLPLVTDLLGDIDTGKQQLVDKNSLDKMCIGFHVTMLVCQKLVISPIEHPNARRKIFNKTANV